MFFSPFSPTPINVMATKEGNHLEQRASKLGVGDIGGEPGGGTVKHAQAQLQLRRSTDGSASACGAAERRAVERRAAERGVTVGVIRVTGDKCADCGLLIGTRTYIYNRWLKLGAEQSPSQIHAP